MESAEFALVAVDPLAVAVEAYRSAAEISCWVVVA